MKKLILTVALSLLFWGCSDDPNIYGPVQPSGDCANSENGCEQSSSATVSSSSVAQDFSSSSIPLVSSSSILQISSSSEIVADPSHLVITDAVAQCDARGVVDDPFVDGATVADVLPDRNDAVLAPVTYRYVGTERTGFTIENITFTCDVIIDTLNVSVSDEIVYVKAKMNYTNAKRCLCKSKVSFAVDNDPSYSSARWLVLDDDSSVNFQNKMEIVDMDVVTIDEVMAHQETKNVDVVCKNDRRMFDKPSLVNSTQLPLVDTVSTKQIYAMRFDNGDGTETISINELDLGCGVNDVQFDVDAYNDTLYVTPKNSASLYATNCICPSRIDFTIKKGLQFTNTHYLVLDKREAMPLIVAKQ